MPEARVDTIRIDYEPTSTGVAVRCVEQRPGDVCVWAAAHIDIPELHALRTRVAELEASPDWAEFRRVKQLADAAAKANEALESIGEQARQRIVDLTAALRAALDHYSLLFSSWTEEQRRGHEIIERRLRKLADRAETETPAPTFARRLLDLWNAACEAPPPEVPADDFAAWSGATKDVLFALGLRWDGERYEVDPGGEQEVQQ